MSEIDRIFIAGFVVGILFGFAAGFFSGLKSYENKMIKEGVMHYHPQTGKAVIKEYE